MVRRQQNVVVLLAFEEDEVCHFIPPLMKVGRQNLMREVNVISENEGRSV